LTAISNKANKVDGRILFDDENADWLLILLII
jgi:hypothetical protein